MSAYQKTAQDLAKSLAMLDVDDLPSLVQLQEDIEALAAQLAEADAESLESAVEEFQSLGTITSETSSLIERIILREVEDEHASFQLLSQSIEYTQRIIDCALSGESPASLSAPVFDGQSADDAEEEIDEELLASWLAGCDAMLGDIESVALSLEAEGADEEALAEVRRFIHTLKGECGVLSLDLASKLCHEAESLIDRSLDAGGAFPSDEVLQLIDWFKSYIALLQTDCRATPPAHDELLKRLTTNASVDGDNPAAPGEPPVVPEPADAVTPSSPGAFDDATPVVMEIQPGTEENINEFLCESREHIASAEEALLELESDFEDAELINSVFRSFHTIKGVAGFMGFGPIVDVAHIAETLLDQARQGDITLNSGYLDLILGSCDGLSKLLESLADGPNATKGQIDALIARLQSAVDGQAPEAIAPAPANPAPAAMDDAAIEFAYPPLGEILVRMNIVDAPSVNAALDAQKKHAEKLRGILDQHGITESKTVEDAFVKGEALADTFRELILEMSLVDAATLDAAIAEAKQGGKRLGELLGLSAKELVPAMRDQRAAKAAAQQASPETEPKPAATARKKPTDQTVKVSTNRMDALVDMVGELVIANQMVMQDPVLAGVGNQRTQKNMSHVAKIIRDLQEVAMSLRMVTLKSSFQKMARLVRDIANKSGKKINFHMEGEDTELDRTVVDEIADPLVHMIRNACDHGIEPVADRVKAGKEPAGNLTLRAYHSGGSIVIEVADDGRGLPREKLLAKAVEKGLIPADRDPASMSDHEVHNLIFAPGFSTAEQVTDLSGRGVGMDVVRRNIEALRGKVEIHSTFGEGSTFVMMLPLTMAIIDGMVVRVGSQRYVIPTLAIQKSYQPAPDELETAMGQGEMISVRGDLLPLYRLKSIFDLPEGLDDPSEALTIIIESNDRCCALMVDEILGQQQVVIKSLGQGVGKLTGLSGGAILGDGRVAPIIDVASLMQTVQKNIKTRSTTPTSTPA